MRPTLLFFLVLLAAPALAQEVELFTDRGETYVRAGTDQGLQRGSAVTVVAKGGKKLGTATVMETWAALSRVNLDEAARADKTPSKYVSFAPAKAAAPEPVAPPPPPPPADADGKRKPLPSPPPPEANAAPQGLKGFAKYGGAGPWTALQVFNENTFDWTSCTITMLPMKASYRMKFLRAGDHEMIGRSNFTNRDYEGDPTSFRAECQQGQATLPIR